MPNFEVLDSTKLRADATRFLLGTSANKVPRKTEEHTSVAEFRSDIRLLDLQKNQNEWRKWSQSRLWYFVAIPAKNQHVQYFNTIQEEHMSALSDRPKDECNIVKSILVASQESFSMEICSIYMYAQDTAQPNDLCKCEKF